MTRPIPMNRLLQGDVGSGKTAVAVYAILVAVAHRHQAVIMAPTEILARQHFGTFSRLLEKSQVRLGLLTGTLSAAERRDIDWRIAQGRGRSGRRHAGDRAGRGAVLAAGAGRDRRAAQVRRAAAGALEAAGQNPHYLVMTATPIPRTVAMTQYGDLDVSIFSEMPPGRQKVNTYLVRPGERAKWWDFFRRKLREGRQGFVVTPLVDESDDLQIRGRRGGLRVAGERRAGGVSRGLGAWPVAARRERGGDGGVPAGASASDRGDERRRGRRGCAQRDADDDRKWASGSGWRSCTSFAGGSRGASFPAIAAFSPTRRRRKRTRGWKRSSRAPTGSTWRKSIFNFAVRAICWARGSMGWRRCGSPT